MKQFYNLWKNKTPLEKEYIEALEKALEWLQSRHFRKDILSIYVKGSFVFRELIKGSDIDLVPVMRDGESLRRIKEESARAKELLAPVDILPLAIQELKTDRYFKEPLPGTKGAPHYFTLLIKDHELVYGKLLNTDGFKVVPTEKVYENLKKVIRDVQIPMYERGEFGFRQVGKQFMHLVWWQEKLKGRKIASSWSGILAACPDNELLQRTYQYRLRPTKDPALRSKYIADLKKYLEEKHDTI